MHGVAVTILGIIGFLIFSIAVIYLAWIAHCVLDRVCVRHAKRFCRRHGLEVSRVRWQMEFEERPDGNRGAKTEFTLVQLDCVNGQKQRRLLLLRVWPFGVRQLISDEFYPES